MMTSSSLSWFLVVSTITWYRSKSIKVYIRFKNWPILLLFQYIAFIVVSHLQITKHPMLVFIKNHKIFYSHAYIDYSYIDVSIHDPWFFVALIKSACTTVCTIKLGYSSLLYDNLHPAWKCRFLTFCSDKLTGETKV